MTKLIQNKLQIGLFGIFHSSPIAVEVSFLLQGEDCEMSLSKRVLKTGLSFELWVGERCE